MTTLLAIDTATEALSVALQRDDRLVVFHERLPRLHQQRIFEALDTLFVDPASELGLDAIVYGKGPGSFTGLRIAASAAQGLGYSLGVPLIGISTLATQARTFLRRESIQSPCVLVSTIDARIGQAYVQSYNYDGSTLVEHGPAVIRPAEDSSPILDAFDPAQELWQGSTPVFAIGDGVRVLDPTALSRCANLMMDEDILPEARDMLEPAQEQLKAGAAIEAADAYPDYVQREIGWKKIAEQGRNT